MSENEHPRELIKAFGVAGCDDPKWDGFAGTISPLVHIAQAIESWGEDEDGNSVTIKVTNPAEGQEKRDGIEIGPFPDAGQPDPVERNMFETFGGVQLLMSVDFGPKDSDPLASMVFTMIGSEEEGVPPKFSYILPMSDKPGIHSYDCEHTRNAADSLLFWVNEHLGGHPGYETGIEAIRSLVESADATEAAAPKKAGRRHSHRDVEGRFTKPPPFSGK